MVGRILRSADFERVLAAPPRVRSTHFALHHLAARPSLPSARLKKAELRKLSTGDAPSCPPPVDDLPGAAPGDWWLGLVVPKRHARRAVTRNLLKRQIRALMQDRAGSLAQGLWVLRLKAPFDVKLFPSAASAALRACARGELSALLDRASAGRAAVRGSTSPPQA